MTAPFIPLDGRITSLQSLPLALTGDEVIEIVSPGNATNGNNYQVLLSVLAAFFSTNVGLQAYTVTTLPTPSAAGAMAYVTDGDSGLAWGDTVVNTGAGATQYAVWFNGSNWTVFGK
jgi:hypothetical protein